MTRPFVVALALALASFAACGSDEREREEPGTTDTSDAGSTDDGSDGGSEAPVAINCIAFHGVHSAGTKWSYRWADPRRTGVRSAKVTALNEQRNEATIETGESWSQTTGGVSVNATITEKFRCDTTGLFLVSARRVFSQNIAGTASSGDSTTTYDPPRFVRPHGPVLGDTWTSSWTGTRTDASGSTPVSGTEAWEVTEDGISVTGGSGPSASRPPPARPRTTSGSRASASFTTSRTGCRVTRRRSLGRSEDEAPEELVDVARPAPARRLRH
jgi:hypothetical protein